MDTFHTQSRIQVDILTNRVKREFIAKFRTEVAKRVLEAGKTVSDVARAHELAPKLIAYWVRQARVNSGQDTSSALSTAEREELSRACRDLMLPPKNGRLSSDNKLSTSPPQDELA